MTLFTFFFTIFFTLWRGEVLGPESNRKAGRGKDAMEKTPNRAGATPLFLLSAAQVNHGVAPALSRVSREPSWLRPGSRTEVLAMHRVRRISLQKEDTHLALLKRPSKQPKTTTLQVLLEEEVRHNLGRYAEFIGANVSYVVSEALKLLFKRDDEFKHWLSDPKNRINHEQVKGVVLTETA